MKAENYIIREGAVAIAGELHRHNIHELILDGMHVVCARISVFDAHHSQWRRTRRRHIAHEGHSLNENAHLELRGCALTLASLIFHTR